MSGLTLNNVGFVGSLAGSPAATGTAANQALVTAAGAQGLLAPTLATGFNFTNNWRLKMRLRQANPTADYVLGIVPGQAADIVVIWNFNAGIYEIYGSADRFGLTAAVTDGLYHTIEFVYFGGVLKGFLDGVAAGSKTSTLFTSNIAATASLAIGLVQQNRSFLGGYDYLIIDVDGVNVVNLTFNEASGSALNTGSNGGAMSFTGAYSRELVP